MEAAFVFLVAMIAGIFIILVLIFGFLVYSAKGVPQLLAARSSRYLALGVVLNLIAITSLLVAFIGENDLYIWIVAVCLSAGNYCVLCWVKLYSNPHYKQTNPYVVRPVFATLLIFVLAVQIGTSATTGRVSFAVFSSPSLALNTGLFVLTTTANVWLTFTSAWAVNELVQALKLADVSGLEATFSGWTNNRNPRSITLPTVHHEGELDYALDTITNPLRNAEFKYQCFSNALLQIHASLFFFLSLIGLIGYRWSGRREVDEFTDVLRTPVLFSQLVIWLGVCFAHDVLFKRYKRFNEWRAARYVNDLDLQWFVNELSAKLNPGNYHYEPFNFSDSESMLGVLDDVLIFAGEIRIEIGRTEAYLNATHSFHSIVPGSRLGVGKGVSLHTEAVIWKYFIQNGLYQTDSHSSNLLSPLDSLGVWKSAKYFVRLAREVKKISERPTKYDG